MSKPVFTDDREKQEPVLGDGDVDGGLDSDDPRPDHIINELIAEGKKDRFQFNLRSPPSLTILFASSHRSPA